ncbi:MAG: hypothetical protein EOO33_08125 [Comamonadaceae bacterium]|nr:MAG: hypothetical protein EOO33_08125 [Comamonadaceae bacterium]
MTWRNSRSRAAGYNSSTMLRWFIAVFTLHFFLSVGVSAFGKASALEPLLHGPHSAASCIQEDALPSLDASLPAAADTAALAETPQEHALADDQHDLLDDVNVRVRPQHDRTGVHPPTRADDTPSPSPAHDVPHKPPRTASLVA